MKKYVCTVCGYIYDPAVGDPGAQVKPGTPFEELQNGWVCPRVWSSQIGIPAG